ncbi:MAG: hypothetical protein GC136_07215 [Alphaproteobacteria bacterium]|nr:hypothetical protein [Alphaproteobacteria bacterium]
MVEQEEQKTMLQVAYEAAIAHIEKEVSRENRRFALECLQPSLDRLRDRWSMDGNHLRVIFEALERKTNSRIKMDMGLYSGLSGKLCIIFEDLASNANYRGMVYFTFRGADPNEIDSYEIESITPLMHTKTTSIDEAEECIIAGLTGFENGEDLVETARAAVQAAKFAHF